MTKEELLNKISTLDNVYICDYVMDAIAYSEEQGMSYEEMWEDFKLEDEMLEEEANECNKIFQCL